MHNRLDTTPRHKPTNPEIRNRLAAYRDEGRSNAVLAREIGVSTAAVSTYLSNKYGGDVEKFEARVENILRTAPIRKLIGTEVFETGVTSAIGGAITTILQTNDFAVVHGPAGIGKTCGSAAYVAANPTSILITLFQDCCNAHYIQKEVFAQIKTGAFAKSKMNRAEWIFDTLKGSNRLLLVDNAHRATIAARKWLFDYHDRTGNPVALFGNPEIIDAIKQNDQQFSRVGLCPEISLDPEEIPAIASMMLHQLCPRLVDDLHAYAVKVASQRGHLRALSKQIRLTLDFMSKGEKDPRAAFRAAHTQLVRNYGL